MKHHSHKKPDLVNFDLDLIISCCTPDHKTLSAPARHIRALGGASGMLHYNLLWTLERRGLHDIVAIYADFSSLWCGPLYQFTYSKENFYIILRKYLSKKKKFIFIYNEEIG